MNRNIRCASCRVAKCINLDHIARIVDCLTSLDTHGDRAIADDGRRVGIEIQNDSGVLVNSDDMCIGWELFLKHCESVFAQVTESRVVMATFGIVVVRNDCDIQSNFA